MASKLRRTAASARLERLEARTLLSLDGWEGYALNPQHTALSPVASQPLTAIEWQTPVDLAPQYSGSELLIHYGSPLVTAANSVIIPVKTGASGGFEIQALSGSTGALQWTLTSNYALEPSGGANGYDWTPSYSPTLTPSNRLYFAGLGGTVDYTDSPDATGPSPPATGQLAFFGLSNYNANPSAYNSTVYINTPITSDAAGDIFFGFLVTGSNPLGLTSGVARIDANGTGSYAAVVAGMSQVATNSAPALSNDGSTLYVLESTGNFASGELVALNSQSLAVKASVNLVDPLTGGSAAISNDSTASPMVGPDGDVYIGVLENPLGSNNYRGWLLHFSGDLSTTKTPGAFGWDDTPSVVPASMVPSYTGTSTYLLMAKYNNYANAGGNGINKIAILDPNATEKDPVTGTPVMNEVLTVAGPTPDPDYDGTHPGAVKEWCINSAAVDPATDSILVGSEDGNLYRWNLATNTFTQQITLTQGVGEAYTPTVIGVDGTVYAINNATLFAVGEYPQIGGPWFIGGNETTQIQQQGSRLTFTNEHGASSPGSFLSADQVEATGWGNLVGTLVPTIDGIRILWANGTSWDQLQLAGQGVIGGHGVQISQNGTSLTFINENGGTSPGYIADVNHVVATGWGNLVGTLTPTFEGFRINWANGTAWDMLRLAGTWFFNGSQPTQIVQPGNGNMLTFINENGGSSAGYIQDNSHVVATGWGNLVGTLVPTAHGAQINWSNGTSWDELELAGQWFIGNNQPTEIYQGADGLTLVNEAGQMSAAYVASDDEIVATDWGNLVGTVVITSTGLQINWSNGTAWYSQV